MKQALFERANDQHRKRAVGNLHSAFAKIGVSNVFSGSLTAFGRCTDPED
jgi:hypothetical protein